MLRVTVSRTFPELDRHSLEVPCPRCRLSTAVFLRQVRLGDVVVCRGCKANIRLVDHMGDYHRARRRINDAFNQMLAGFRGLGG